MKKLSIGLLAVMLLIGCCQQAEAMSTDSIRSKTICEEGYKFLLVWSSQGDAPVVTQIYQAGFDVNRPPQPMKCGK